MAQGLLRLTVSGASSALVRSVAFEESLAVSKSVWEPDFWSSELLLTALVCGRADAALSCAYRGTIMVARASRPNVAHIALLVALVLVGAITIRGPLDIGNKYVDLTLGIVVLFSSVVVFGRFRIDVSKARRSRGFREWSGVLTSHRLMIACLLLSLALGSWHIYDACLRFFPET